MPILYQLYREQVIKTDIASAWAFISNPLNLSKITPSDMSLSLVSEVPSQVYDGLLIEYRVALPLLGEQLWLSELKHIKKHCSFVDEQLAGPYNFWYHYHEIDPHPRGVCFRDHVRYILPLGLLGQLIHPLYVRKKLNYIFDFRREAMKQLLEAK